MDQNIIPLEHVERRIYVIRGQKVMLDRDLAELYGVKTHVLNQAVKRNISRFPEDFMFRLSLNEAQNLISQFVISSSGWGGMRHLPMVFTEHGIAMLSSVLKSERAISVNIQIIRAFLRLREMIVENDGLRHKLELLEKQYDEQFKIVFNAIHRLLDENDAPPSEIGFRD